MSHFQDDPYDWTIDRVIAEIAPDDKTLAESLRVNEVDGEVLLTVCTYERLKDDIGIIPLGRRSKIMRTIEGLRRRSDKYADHILDIASSIALPDDAGSVAGYSPKAIRSLGTLGFGTPAGSRKRKSSFLDGPLTSPLRYSAAPATPELPPPPSPPLLLPEAPIGVRQKRAKPLCLLAAEDDNLPLLVPESALHFAGHSAVRIVRNEETGVGGTVPYSQEREVSESPSIEDMDLDLNMEMNHDMASPTGRLSGNREQYENRDEVGMAMDMSPEVSLAGDREDQNELEEDSDGSREDLIENGEPSASRDFETAGDNAEPKPDPSESKLAKRASRKRHYLPVRGLMIDEIIYGKTEVGNEIQSGEEDREFFMVSLNKPLGQQQYVARQIRHLLQTPESVTVVHQGHLRTGIKPYREDLVLKHYHQAVTLFTAQADGSCKVSRQNTSTVALPWSTSRGTQASSSDTQIIRFQEKPDRPQAKLNVEDNSIHDWDYLTKWQNITEDEELPLFGDSGSEGEYSVGTWADMEAEWGPQEKPIGKTRREPLTVEEVQQVLTDGVKVIIENWREKFLPRKEAQAWRLYRVAKKKRERKKTARDARIRIKELDERLGKMRDEVCGITWTHKGNVKKQVKILQPTVQDREEQRWLACLMERKKAPQRPEKVAGREEAIEVEEGELDLDDGDDEESLGSTSEEDYDGDEDEEMDGFIVPDTEKDVVNGVEVEVQGEKEVEEELAKKAAENELIDSDDSEDETPGRIRKVEGHKNKGKGPEEEVQPEQEDQHMAGMDDEAGDTTMDENMPTPNLDKQKGKGKAIVESPPPIVKQEPSAAPQTTREHASKKDIPIIDLTMDEPPEQPKGKGHESRKSLGEIQHIDIDISEDEEPTPSKTPQLIVAQLVRETDQNKREAIWFRVEEFHTPDLFNMATVFARQLHSKKIRNVAGLDEYDHLSDPNEAAILKLEARYNAQVYRPITQYYVAWVLGKIDNKKLSPLEFKAIDNLKEFTKFRTTLIEILKPYIDTGLSQGFSSPSSLKNGKGSKVKSGTSRKVVSESDSEMTPAVSGHRRRPRKEVVEDPTAKAKREQLDKTMKNMQRRAKDQEKRSRLTGVESGVGKVRINIGKYAKDDDIFFHPLLAASLKQHQIDGIRFMWQQLVQTGENRGALLAHTMGLGKTLQVIALLYTLATAARSPDKRTYGQIPEHLRVSKSLVLSPPGLVENWWDEFRKWLPTVDPNSNELDLDNIGEIIRADGTVPYNERLRNIEKWYVGGGVLLMGYQAFRGLVLNSKDIEEEEHARIKNMLLNGPNIIIADEAHQLKNPTAKIYEAARGFKSMSRIAMTGSPLSNNLLEYWSMIDWIDPMFLGPRKEFEQKYVQPINDGLYADSTDPEKRKCLKMLTVLKTDIGPKVHRMDISVIEKDLPPKTEFLIKVPLTMLQLKMYKKFLKDPTTTGRMGDIDIKEVSGGRFFDVIHLMSLICNHPLCFVETLEAREKGNQETRTRPLRRQFGNHFLDDELEDLDDPDGVNHKFMDDLLSETNQPYPWAREMISTVDDGSSLEHSYKMMLVKSIIECTIKAGDQLLLFTHSVMTLSYLEKQLEKWRYKFQKLDGKTQMNTRQAITKRFNKGEGGSVCLISTEAGGLGLNLPGANRIIIFDFKWSPMWEEQAVGRGFRLGQKKHVFVYRFHACGTYEEIMRNKVLFKNQLHSRVVDKRDPIRYATKNGKQYFAEPYDVPKEDLTEFKGKDPQVLDHIIERVDFIRSIQYTETFQHDENDVLTEEEIRETEEMLNEAKHNRKAQGQQNDAARKADDDFRKRSLELAKQAESQIEQERLAESRRLPDATPNPPAASTTKPSFTGTNAPVTPQSAATSLSAGLVRYKLPSTTPKVAGKDQNAAPPRSTSSASRPNAPVAPQGAAASLSAGIVRLKLPSTTPEVTRKDQDAAPPKGAPSASRLNAPTTPQGAATSLSAGLVHLKLPSTTPRKDQGAAPPRRASSNSSPTPPVPKVKPNSGPAVPSTTLPQPPSSLTENNYNLNMSRGLPSIFKRAEKDNFDKSGGNPDGAESKESKEAAPVGMLKLKG